MDTKQNLIERPEDKPELIKTSEDDVKNMKCPMCGTNMYLEEESNVFICSNCHRALLNHKK
jgi:hypothetical protein